MATDKKSFVLYCDLLATVTKLPDDKAGQLFKHVLAYVNDQNPETDDILIQIAFEPIKQQLKRDLKKWERYIEKQVENGKKGGRPEKPKEPNETQKTQAFFQKPKKADNVNVSVNVNDNVNDNVSVSDIVNTRKPAFTKPTQEQVYEVIKDTFEAEKFFNYYESNGWRVGKNPMKNWKSAAANWIKNIKIYATDRATNGNGGQKLGTSAARIEALKRW